MLKHVRGGKRPPRREPTTSLANPAPRSAQPATADPSCAIVGSADGPGGCPPFHALPRPWNYCRTTGRALGATFDPVAYAAWAATLDDAGRAAVDGQPQPAPGDAGPRRAGLAELQRSQAERQALAPRPAPPAEPPAPRLSQSLLTLPAPAPAASEAPIAGIQALRAELERIEREARRYFAQKAVNAGKQAQIRAAAVRRQLAALEGDAERSASRGSEENPGATEGHCPPFHALPGP